VDAITAYTGIQRNEQAKDLHAYLEMLQAHGMMFGHQEASLTGCQLATGDPWNPATHPRKNTGGTIIGATEDPDVFRVCGKHPAVLGLDFAYVTEREYFDKGTLYPAQRFFSSFPDFKPVIANLVREHHRNRGIVTFGWHTVNPQATLSFRPEGKKLSDVLLAQNDLHATLKDKLSLIADFVNTELKDDDGKPIPIIFRPYHENNVVDNAKTGWWWWSYDPSNTSYSEAKYREDYKDLWRRTACLLADKKVHGLLYAYSPGQAATTGDFVASFLGSYPGRDWTDVLGVDFYTYERHAVELFDQVEALYIVAWWAGKLWAITETGLKNLTRAGGVVKDYWTDEYALPLWLPELSWSVPEARCMAEMILRLAAETLKGKLKTALGATPPAGKARGPSYSLVWKNLKNNGKNAVADPDEHYAPYPGHASVADFRKLVEGTMMRPLDRTTCSSTFRAEVLFREDLLSLKDLRQLDEVRRKILGLSGP
jgi:hypothetical protein